MEKKNHNLIEKKKNVLNLELEAKHHCGIMKTNFSCVLTTSLFWLLLRGRELADLIALPEVSQR